MNSEYGCGLSQGIISIKFIVQTDIVLFQVHRPVSLSSDVFQMSNISTILSETQIPILFQVNHL